MFCRSKNRNEDGDDVVYTEPVTNYLEGNARRVSIEVYDDTPLVRKSLYFSTSRP